MTENNASTLTKKRQFTKIIGVVLEILKLCILLILYIYDSQKTDDNTLILYILNIKTFIGNEQKSNPDKIDKNINISDLEKYEIYGIDRSDNSGISGISPIFLTSNNPNNNFKNYKDILTDDGFLVSIISVLICIKMFFKKMIEHGYLINDATIEKYNAIDFNSMFNEIISKSLNPILLGEEFMKNLFELMPNIIKHISSPNTLLTEKSNINLNDIIDSLKNITNNCVHMCLVIPMMMPTEFWKKGGIYASFTFIQYILKVPLLIKDILDGINKYKKQDNEKQDNEPLKLNTDYFYYNIKLLSAIVSIRQVVFFGKSYDFFSIGNLCEFIENCQEYKFENYQIAYKNNRIEINLDPKPNPLLDKLFIDFANYCNYITFMNNFYRKVITTLLQNMNAADITILLKNMNNYSNIKNVVLFSSEYNALKVYLQRIYNELKNKRQGQKTQTFKKVVALLTPSKTKKNTTTKNNTYSNSISKMINSVQPTFNMQNILNGLDKLCEFYVGACNTLIKTLLKSVSFDKKTDNELVLETNGYDYKYKLFRRKITNKNDPPNLKIKLFIEGMSFAFSMHKTYLKIFDKINKSKYNMYLGLTTPYKELIIDFMVEITKDIMQDSKQQKDKAKLLTAEQLKLRPPPPPPGSPQPHRHPPPAPPGSQQPASPPPPAPPGSPLPGSPPATPGSPQPPKHRPPPPPTRKLNPFSNTSKLTNAQKESEKLRKEQLERMMMRETHAEKSGKTQAFQNNTHGKKGFFGLLKNKFYRSKEQGTKKGVYDNKRDKGFLSRFRKTKKYKLANVTMLPNLSMQNTKLPNQNNNPTNAAPKNNNKPIEGTTITFQNTGNKPPNKPANKPANNNLSKFLPEVNQPVMRGPRTAAFKNVSNESNA